MHLSFLGAGSGEAERLSQYEGSLVAEFSSLMRFDRVRLSAGIAVEDAGMTGELARYSRAVLKGVGGDSGATLDDAVALVDEKVGSPNGKDDCPKAGDEKSYMKEFDEAVASANLTFLQGGWATSLPSSRLRFPSGSIWVVEPIATCFPCANLTSPANHGPTSGPL